MKTTQNESNADAVPSKPVDAKPLTSPPRRFSTGSRGLELIPKPHADADTRPSAAGDAATSLRHCLLTIRREPSTRIESVSLEEGLVSFEEKENDLFTRTCNESSIDLMRRRACSQAAKLPSCQAAKLPSCQAAKLPSCQAAKLPSCQAKSLRKLVSYRSNKNPSATTESPFNLGVASGFFPTVGASESTGELRGYHQ
jgi:hypothetical protein